MDQQKFKKFATLGLIGVAGLVVAPIIFLTIKGIIGLAIAGVLAATVMALAPAVSQWLTNLKFKALEKVISYEPVLTLKASGEQRWKELDTQRNLLEEMQGSLQQFKAKATSFIRTYPEEAESWNQRMQNYEQIFAYRVDLFKKAKIETEKFMRAVDKAESVYDMAVLNNSMSKAFNKNSDFMTMFNEKTAFEAIDKTNSAAMASLQMAMIDEEYVSEQIKLQAEPVRAVSYTPAGTVNLGNILDIQEIAPENIRIKA